MDKKGLTPREMRLGSRMLITFEAAADWRREREEATAAEDAANAAKPPRPKKPVSTPTPETTRQIATLNPPHHR